MRPAHNVTLCSTREVDGADCAAEDVASRFRVVNVARVHIKTDLYRCAGTYGEMLVKSCGDLLEFVVCLTLVLAAPLARTLWDGVIVTAGIDSTSWHQIGRGETAGSEFAGFSRSC